MTHPNNPTGATYTEEELKKIAAACLSKQVTVLADEIYFRLAYKKITSLADYYPQHTIRTSSLSKEVGCGGWRCGWMVFPAAEESIYQKLMPMASSIYSCASHNLQKCAAYTLTNPIEIKLHIENMRHLFQVGGELVYSMLKDHFDCTKPEAAWYIWVNFDKYKDKLNSRGITTSGDLVKALAEEIGFVAVPGQAFGLDGLSMRLSFVDLDENYGWTQVEKGLTILINWFRTM